MLEILKNFLSEKGYTCADEQNALRNFVSSLNIVELICFVEDTLDIVIPDEDTYIFSENLITISIYLEKYSAVTID